MVSGSRMRSRIVSPLDNLFSCIKLTGNYKESAGGPSKSKLISAPVIQNGVMVQERPSRAVKQPQNPPDTREPSDTNAKVNLFLLLYAILSD
jgi:hypothetical protein